MGTTHWLQRPQTCWKFDKEASRNITVTPPQTNQKKVYSLQPSPQTSPLKNHLLEFPSGLAVGTAKKKKKKKKKERKEKPNKTKPITQRKTLSWCHEWGSGSIEHELLVLFAWHPAINTVCSLIVTQCQQIGFAAGHMRGPGWWIQEKVECSVELGRNSDRWLADKDVWRRGCYWRTWS